jgi:hypothetical protein
MATNRVKEFGSRAYSGGQARPQNQYVSRPGDNKIHDLFLEYTVFPQRTVYWDFRKKVINEALRLFTGNFNWFIRQDSNAQVTGYSYEFLQDTLRFIATGRRRLDIHTWPGLISDEPESGVQLVENRHDIRGLFQLLQLSTSPEAMIQQWCSHKKGFDDMMYTLHLLFGTVSMRIKDGV